MEGSYSPRLPNGKRKKSNIYAPTKEECEVKLKELIAKAKEGIAEEIVCASNLVRDIRSYGKMHI